MSNQYLLEVGTEELPSGFLQTAPVELKEKVEQLLDEEEIAYQSVQVLATPRRLALIIAGLPATQPDRKNKLKGPPVRIALDASGNLTKAGEGFARKTGVSLEQMERETLDGEAYLVVNQLVQGRLTQEILAEKLPEVVLGLSGSHFMAWGESTIRFSRPIRWLVSLWNDVHLPVQIGEVQSGTYSAGHRVLAKQPVQIPSVAQYQAVLEEEGAVLVDQTRRGQMIWQDLQDAATQAGGCVRENPALLDTVTMLVENPSVLIGQFEERFLEIPDEVIQTVMIAHQKYFPVEKKTGGLLPRFLIVSNGRPEAAETIQHGNAKVITARFEDARFFYQEDQKVPLLSRLEQLKGITFQKGLGSMYEKAMRLEALSAKVAQMLGYSKAQVDIVCHAAKLAKCDLVTNMVFEFTELQGVMGKKYAELQGEPPEVAEAICEHYLPRFMGDAVAKTPAGIAVSLADKLDTMMAVFGQKDAKLPTGSKDPMGLRRMAVGVIHTVLENDLDVNLPELLEQAYDQLGPLATEDRDVALKRIQEFIRQRLRVSLLEQNFRYDVVDAVLEAKNPLCDLPDVMERLALMARVCQSDKLMKALYEPANRIARILGEQADATVSMAEVQPTLFKDASEEALYQAIQSISAQSYEALLQDLERIAPTIEQFFNSVLVNDPDEAVRKNRYNLLGVLHQSYVRLANFSKLAV